MDYIFDLSIWRRPSFIIHTLLKCPSQAGATPEFWRLEFLSLSWYYETLPSPITCFHSAAKTSLHCAQFWFVVVPWKQKNETEQRKLFVAPARHKISSLQIIHFKIMNNWAGLNKFDQKIKCQNQNQVLNSWTLTFYDNIMSHMLVKYRRGGWYYLKRNAMCIFIPERHPM